MNKDVISVELRAKDNTKIVGDYFPGFTDKGVLLLHMMPSTRDSWDEFALCLQEEDIRALAIDLRGHGESARGPEGYKSFADEEHQQSILDVEAGAEFLLDHKVTELFLVGASIGANLALQFAVTHPEVYGVVLLSPGLDYKGIKTLPFVQQLQEDQKIFFVASRDDFRSSGISNADMAETLFQHCSAEKEIKIFDDAGHGTTIFERYPDFMNDIIDWMENTYENTYEL